MIIANREEVNLQMRGLRMGVIYRSPQKIQEHLDNLMEMGGPLMEPSCIAEAAVIREAIENQEYLKIYRILARAECCWLRGL